MKDLNLYEEIVNKLTALNIICFVCWLIEFDRKPATSDKLMEDMFSFKALLVNETLFPEIATSLSFVNQLNGKSKDV